MKDYALQDPVLVITRGVSGSGKTTWAKNWIGEGHNRVRVNRDDIRTQLFDSKSGLHFQQEDLVTQVEHASIREALRKKFSVVVDAMHLRPKYVKALISLAEEEGVTDIYEVPFVEPLKVILDRNSMRPSVDRLPEDAIKTMYQKYMPKGTLLEVTFPTSEVREESSTEYVPDENLPRAVIVDIDGTIANMGSREPFNFSKVSEDTPHSHIIFMVESLVAQGIYPVFVSGRDDSCFNDTIEWITDNVSLDLLETDSVTLHMRKTGDQRKDAIVKREIFDTHIRDNFNVLFAIDDRDQVVRMWRDMGLPCVQVAEGNF